MGGFIVKLCVASMLALVVSILLPEGQMRKFAVYGVSVLVTAVLVSEISGFLGSSMDILAASPAAALTQTVTETRADPVFGLLGIVDARYENGVLVSVTAVAGESGKEAVRRAITLRFGERVEIIFREE